MRIRLALGSLLAAGGLLLAACSSTPTASESLVARKLLRADVARVAREAAAHDEKAARQALGSLRAAVSRFETNGGLSRERAGEILAAASAVDAKLALLVKKKAPSVPASTTPSTTLAKKATKPTDQPAKGPPSSPPGKGDGGDGNGKGQGQGQGQS